MVSCKIKGCRNRSDNKNSEKLHFFSFPKDQKIASKWLEVCKEIANIKNSRVCSSHFKPTCYKPRLKHLTNLNYSRIGVRILLPDAIPTENIASEDLNKITTKSIKSVKNINQFNEQNVKGFHIPTTKKSTPKDDVPAVLLLQVHNNLQPYTISSTPLTSVKYIGGHPNLDVRLERIEAPAHVLDHQYAVNKDINLDPMSLQTKETDNGLHVIVDKTNNLEKNSVSKSKESDEALIAHLRKELQVKTEQNQNLQKQIKRLQKGTNVIVNKKINEVLKSIFSSRQIEKLMHPYKTKIKWSVEDIISAISLQNISIKAYCYLRENNYPLPGLSTIQKWTARINVNEGMLMDLLILMKYKAKSLSVFQKIIVLNFGETCISNKNCTICIIRGLFYKWMQPIYYSYDLPLSSDIIIEIVSKLYDIGYIVAAITCKLESLDTQICTDLNIGLRQMQECYFEHPCNKNYKIFIFPEESYLLSLIRNQFLDNGFIVKSKQVNKNCIEEIINIKKQLEGEEYHKLTKKLIENSKYNKENTLLAKKLFSKITAQEITGYGQEDFIHYKDWKETAYFFKLISEWIDLFSSKTKEGYEEGKEPYGLCLQRQKSILNKVEKLMHLTKIEGFETWLPFQEQVILRGFSLQQLLKYLQESFSIEDFQIKYIFTDRLSSELLENFIENISGKDASDDESTTSMFQDRLRKCILGKYSSNVEFNQVTKTLEPCLIDFNERSDSKTVANADVQKPKGFASETAEKMRRFLTVNKISTQKVHKNLQQILNKKT